MRYPALLLGILLSSCAAQPTREEALMDAIEKGVQLPPGAKSLNSYGRYYTYADSGKVTAIYLLPMPSADTVAGCSTIVDDTLVPCTAEEIAEARKMEVEMQARQLEAGERRWVKDESEIPHIMDGGCSQVSILFGIAEKRVIRIGCNGDA